jgi:hypothetical protein
MESGCSPTTTELPNSSSHGVGSGFISLEMHQRYILLESSKIIRLRKGEKKEKGILDLLGQAHISLNNLIHGER